MHRIKSTLKKKIWRLLIVLVVVLPAALAAGAADVQAGGGGIFPVIGIIAAGGKRNKVYRTAEGFIDEKTRYYDTLRETARQQLLDRTLTFGLQDNQVAAYVKLVNLIEGEREAMLGFAESEKKAARDEFIDVVQDEITNRMLASTPATQLLGVMGKSISSSQDFLGTAGDMIAGGSGGALEEIQKVKKIAERLTIAGQLIGGDFGQTIRSAGAKVVDIIGKPTAEIEAGLIQVQEELGELGDLVSELQGQGYTPTASQTTRDVVIALITGDESNPAITAIADMLVAKHGGGGNFRERAKAILQGNASARCAARTEQIRQVVLRLEMNIEGEEPPDDSDLPTCQVIDIPALVAETVRAAETESAGADGAEPSPQAAELKEFDLCDLLPQGGELGSTSEYMCFATYSDQPGVRTVQLGLSPSGESSSQCQGIVNSDYAIIMNELDLGECGYQVESGYLGTPQSGPGYEGWGIHFAMEGINVKVMTNVNYSANDTWIFTTAGQIENTIKEYLGLD